MNRHWMVAMAALASLLAVTPIASASSGTMVVTSSTTLSEDHEGNILIDANDVILDCAGHTVFGPGEPGFSGGINVGYMRTGVVVRRCAVTGFDVNGLYAAAASGGRYEDNLFYANGNHGMHLDFGSGNVVADNESRSNGAIGIVLTHATGSSILRNLVQDNRNWAGVALFGDDSNNNVVIDNTAIRNAIGFELEGASGNELRSNTANLSIANGFLFIGGAGNNVLESNTANRNLIGISIEDGSNANMIRNNVANANAEAGFTAFGANGNTFTGNTGNANRSFGFYVFAGSSSNTLTRNVGHGNRLLDANDDDSGTGNVWSENNFSKTVGF